MSGRGRRFDAIVIGGGLSGMAAALQLADAGLKVGLLAKGGGFLHFTSGCVDVLGRDPAGKVVRNPLVAAGRLVQQVGSHPYAVSGKSSLLSALQRFGDLMEAANLPFTGALDANLMLPTAAGSTRPTCLAPAGMAGGDVQQLISTLIVGFEHFRDFYPPYLAANLARTASFEVRHVYLDVPAFRGRRHLSPLDMARAFDDPLLRQEVGRLVKANLGRARRVGFPAVLGIEAHLEAIRHLEDSIGRPVFEIPTLPPSVAGIRMGQALRRQLNQRGARVEIGFRLTGQVNGSRVTEITVDSAGQPTVHQADVFILATGGTGSGGIIASADGTLRESVFGLSVQGPESRTDWYRSQFLGNEPQPISLAGVRTNARLQPFTKEGEVVENVFVTASNLANWDPVREQSGEGVALATAYKAATEALASINGPVLAGGLDPVEAS